MRALIVTLLLSLALAQTAPEKTILQNVQATPELSTLYSLVSGYPSIVSLLNSTSNSITLFAPTNDAFTAAIAGGLDAANAPLVGALLSYHALQDAYSSSALPALVFPLTYLDSPDYVNLGLDGVQVVSVAKSASGVTLNWGIPGVASYSSHVTQADIQSVNGYIHIINSTLMIPQNVSTVAAAGGLTTLLSALKAANLETTVNTAAHVTIFAPINAAFNDAIILPGTEEHVLTGHVYAGGALYSTDLSDTSVTSLNDEDLSVVVNSAGVFINGAKVLIPNILTNNGVVHVIDRVLFTPNKKFTIAENIAVTSVLSDLSSIIDFEPVYNALDNPNATLTLFAPNNNAFDAAFIPEDFAFVTDLLMYHVVGATVPSSALAALQFPNTLLTNQTYVNIGANKGQVIGVSKSSAGVKINYGIPGSYSSTANVTYADITSSNGVIHVVDQVFVFPKVVSQTAINAGLDAVVDALDMFNLTTVVDTTPAITIFAPTNAAIASAAATVNITADVLTYHVVPGVKYSTDLSSMTVTTLQGATLQVSVSSSGVTVTDGQGRVANVVVANVLTKNGVVHVIDKVLLLDSSASLFSPFSLLLALLVLANL